MENLSKVCNKCSTIKPVTEFHKHKTGKFGVHSWCKPCVCIYYKGRYPDKYVKERTRKALHAKQRRINVKIEVFSYYSGGQPRCACCGETEIKFLSLDHINNDGAAYRKKGGKGGSQMYAKLKTQGYPKGYQVLCYNCNCAKGFYGICPHLTYKGGAK